MILRTLALSSLAAAALVATGCTAYDTDNHGTSAQIEPSHNFLGIVKTSPGSYIPKGEVFNLSSDEVMARRDFSGNNVELLWGAITLTDY